MRELGYVEGKNLVIEWRSAEGKTERLRDLAEELVRLHVDALMAAGTSATIAAQKTTTTIPIVMAGVGDPVGAGMVTSLARPGGNTTGLSSLNVDITPKRLEMLIGLMPKLSRVAVLLNPSNRSNVRGLEEVQAAGQKRGIRVLSAEAQTPQEIDKAFLLMAKDNSQALIVVQDPLFIQQIRQIAELAMKHRLPSVAAYRNYVEAGGLMSYGNNLLEVYRRAATYIDKIFKGVKPGDIPIEQPTLFEMFINGKTARALGLKSTALAPDQRRQGNRVT